MEKEPSVVDRFFAKEPERLAEIHRRSPMVTGKTYSSKKKKKVEEMRLKAKSRNFKNLDEEE